MPRSSLRSVRGGQPYIEAFPALDSLTIERELKAGRTCCQWTNEQGVIIGHVEVLGIEPTRLSIATRFLGAVNVGYKHSTDLFQLRRKQHNDSHDRATIVCPVCGRDARFIYNVAGQWACRTCHDLTRINRRLNEVTKYLRRLQELKVLLARGRPRYGRKAAFEELREEYGRLLGNFSDARALPAELGFAQYAEWLSAADPRLKREVESGEPGYGWTRFDEGGFKRITWAAEQERARQSEAEFDRRGQGGEGTVKPLWSTGPNVEQKPFAAEPGSAPPAPKPLRLDFSHLTGFDDDE